jgi:hypothetical protein
MQTARSSTTCEICLVGWWTFNQIRDLIAHWVQPLVEGLEVLIVETAPGRVQLMIHVPPQRPEVWPHIVTRGDLGGRLRARSVAICVRDDADVRSLDANQVHALLAAGRRSREIGSRWRTRFGGLVSRRRLTGWPTKRSNDSHRYPRGDEDHPGAAEPVICRYIALHPTTLLLEVRGLCTALAAHGLPAHETARGWLMPGANP